MSTNLFVRFDSRTEMLFCLKVGEAIDCFKRLPRTGAYVESDQENYRPIGNLMIGAVLSKRLAAASVGDGETPPNTADLVESVEFKES